MKDGLLLGRLGTDGKLWSEEFCKRFPQCAVDDVLGWLCNAIMAGYDEGRLVERRDRCGEAGLRVGLGNLDKASASTTS